MKNIIKFILIPLFAITCLNACKLTSTEPIETTSADSTLTPITPKTSQSSSPSSQQKKDWLLLLIQNQRVSTTSLSQEELDRWRLEYSHLLVEDPYFDAITFEEYLQAADQSLEELEISSDELTKTHRQFFETIVLSSLSNQLIQEKINQTVSVSEAQVRELYQSRINDYMTPESVRIRLLLVATQEEADNLMTRLEAGDDFSDLAREFSLHSSRDQGGELPPFTRGTYAEEIESSAFLLGTGEIGMAKSSRGIFLIQKVSGTSQKTVPFESVKDELRNELELQAKRNALKAMISQ